MKNDPNMKSKIRLSLYQNVNAILEDFIESTKNGIYKKVKIKTNFDNRNIYVFVDRYMKDIKIKLYGDGNVEFVYTDKTIGYVRTYNIKFSEIDDIDESIKFASIELDEMFELFLK